jgi:asparagine synthase (glutamine-hydrolysing)
MCAIAGCWSWRVADGAKRELKLVQAMSLALAHRGPDGFGTWADPGYGVVLGHRRLAILDLSPAGHQPMQSQSSRYVVSYNGEIYNFRELRAELAAAGCVFRGGSDTEVMLAAVEKWGINAAVEKFNGMFAIALWDREERKLSLVRDRLGKKPLYYSMVGDRLLFASELRSLMLDPELGREIDPSALAEFFRYGFIPAPRSILTHVRKVLPGEILEVTREENEKLVILRRRYWAPSELLALVEPFRGSYDAALDELHHILVDAVRIRLESDVPLGAFLSGGIDSSLVVALMREVASGPVRSFTIGFEEKEFDESAHARAVATVLGTDHTETRLKSTDVLDLVPSIARVFDEPFADVSQLPTLLVSKVARQYVTVALSGDGGDEWFGGYTRYLRYGKAQNAMRIVPGFLRTASAAMLSSLSRYAPADLRLGMGDTVRRQMNRGAELLRAGSREMLYECFLSHWEDPAALIAGNPGYRPLSEWAPTNTTPADSRVWMMLIDAGCYLPDDILVKLDRSSMSVALETRSPLLDRRIAEFAVSLPDEYKFDARGGKRILRDLAARYVPRDILERPKQGFAVPLGRWLRGPLRDWADERLSTSALSSSGLLVSPEITKRWKQHQQGQWDWSASLWDVLMFQAWYGEFMHSPTESL